MRGVAMFDRRSPEEKAAAAAQEQREQERAEWEASPPGQAQAAFHRGDLFFQVEIPHSKMSGYATAGVVKKRTTHDGATDVLGQIESSGWHLEHASWVYVQTGQDSRDKFLQSGQQVVVLGEVVGLYLFRRVA